MCVADVGRRAEELSATTERFGTVKERGPVWSTGTEESEFLGWRIKRPETGKRRPSIGLHPPVQAAVDRG
jgi:hypothetical protein